MTMSVKASARKSLGEYKPLIVFPDGSTQIVEQADERQLQYSISERRYFRENKYARGTTYKNREDAINAAQIKIDMNLKEARERLVKFESNAPEHLREKLIASVKREILFWGGE